MINIGTCLNIFSIFSRIYCYKPEIIDVVVVTIVKNTKVVKDTKGAPNDVVSTCKSLKRCRLLGSSRDGALIRASSESEVEIEFLTHNTH